MSPGTAADGFPVTRSTIDELDGWVHRLAAPLLPPQRIKRRGRAGFRWRFRDETAYVLMVGKAVRMVSGIRAAMLLIDNGFVAEAASLVRIVSDLALEIVAVAEGELRDSRTKAQQDFVAEFFARKSIGEDDNSLQQAKKRYVNREELMKTHVRLAKDAGLDGEGLRDLMRTIAGVYDGYVHGSYSSSMELYHGERHEFMLRGHEGTEQRVVYRTALSGKLHEVIQAISMIALVARDEGLHSDIQRGLNRLEKSEESTG